MFYKGIKMEEKNISTNLKDFKISIELTINEINVLRKIIDIAVKSKGMEIAEAAVVLDRKIQEGASKGFNKTEQLDP
jgi:hypothetical protein